MQEQPRVSISSPPDREMLVADLFLGNQQWAEINQEHGEPVIEIYPSRSGDPWVMKCNDVIDAINAGLRRLTGNAP